MTQVKSRKSFAALAAGILLVSVLLTVTVHASFARRSGSSDAGGATSSNLRAVLAPRASRFSRSRTCAPLLRRHQSGLKSYAVAGSAVNKMMLSGCGGTQEPCVSFAPLSEFQGLRRAQVNVRSDVDDRRGSSLDLLSSMLGQDSDSEDKSSSSSPSPTSDQQPVAVSAETFKSIEAVFNQAEVDGDALANELKALKEQGILKRWGSDIGTARPRSINVNQLQSAGIKNPEALAFGSTEDDLLLLVSYVLTSSLLATIAGNVLPGQLGFFVPYLIAGSSLVLLGIGSTNPGLLQGPKAALGRLNPEYEKRLIRHEAAHFLVGYLLGVPVTQYSIATPTGASPHVEFAELMQEERMMEKVPKAQLEVMGPLAMSGLAAEGLEYDTVKGGQADLLQLQLLMNRAEPAMSPTEQQDFTRWAVYRAVELVKYNKRAHEALMEAMAADKSVLECIQAIEGI
uniref:Peptidase M41 domain-containing protein n=1 Tax=Norrisiella sphaerica TaxID=552664 RepID=A0A7S2VUJ3_9EUKA|mmetsp:Transcript_1441/g.1976  ORF Transcript_1441/g.1976 Transcript_1441/m.1976 type:complete len:456 (+) Transcript_1441:80-1447(+)|eukprot:CAMPEP_0184486958 /NCGR_PEP_ID=MMETSP0113_2-20130426/8817_1 /TAXON_ID=91329 /ORGANISM="Norrisiella sphaerica, Strain BC52" /LENGTH=455 /DNA_ID=CAMNT_0026869051 /DNA_START=80 /DNA_END=1447 /DNA_ORIENTATION=+